MVIGGQAVLVHGEPRLTRDIDITVGTGPEGIAAILEVVRDVGLTPLADDPHAFASQTLVVPSVDASSGIRVDLILSLTSYEAQAMRRAQSVAIGGALVRVATAEDLIVHKVIAGRPRDLEDVRSVLLKNPGVDRGYVRRWLLEFEVATDAEGAERPGAVFERLIEGVR